MADAVNWKPQGYTSVAPYLIVDGAQELIDFLRETFDAKQLRRLDGEGKVRHAEVRIGDTVVMLADSLPEWPATPVNIHVYVPDVDAVYARALAAGAAPVQEPVRKGDVDKRGGFRDPVGNTWWVATQQEVDPTVPAA
ncbi:MAG: VOC family protein [Candidatus Cloacimonetes bacterium]|jgi:PhnB protein|nr:VOC family protein [Candidatus Cloacimonadota bacterium]